MIKKNENLWMLLVITVLAAVILSSCGGAQSSPEKVARAWVEAVVDGDCGKARTYWSPNDPGDDVQFCGPEATKILVFARINKVDVDPHVDLAGMYPDLYDVILYGSFNIHCSPCNWGEGRTKNADRVEITVEEVAEDYYVSYFFPRY